MIVIVTNVKVLEVEVPIGTVGEIQTGHHRNQKGEKNLMRDVEGQVHLKVIIIQIIKYELSCNYLNYYEG